jgi:YD repeat-containing protein
MTITIGAITFDHVEYDADGDVLYLSVGEPREPTDSFGTAEGHNVRYDELGRVIAITLVNAKWLLERDGEVRVTIPSRVSADALAPAIAA